MNNLGESQKHYAEGKRDTEQYIVYEFIYMKLRIGKTYIGWWKSEDWLPIGGGNWLEKGIRELPGLIGLFYVVTRELVVGYTDLSLLVEWHT